MEQITISNCNNIVSATICIEPNKLNILYGMNGAGKSTLAKAIAESSRDVPDYSALIPYNQTGTIQPDVSGKRYSHVALFNDEYISRYAFQKDTLLKDSFEIFIKTPEYDAAKSAVDNTLANIRLSFSRRESLTIMKQHIDSLLNQTRLTSKNTIRKNPGFKSVCEGKGRYFDPPTDLLPMRPFLANEIVTDWADWRFKGEQFSTSGICPFCSTKDNAKTKAVSKAFTENFDKASITYTVEMKKALEGLMGYLDPKKLELLLSLFGIQAQSDAFEKQLNKLAVEALEISQKLNAIISFNANRVDKENIKKLAEQLNMMRINPAICDDFFTGDKAVAEIGYVNEQIDELLKQIDELRRTIGRYQSIVAKTIEAKQEDMNDLLSNAGFRYRFDIKFDDDNNARAVLEYVMPDDSISQNIAASSGLSWGERHAFALVMFMFDAIRQNADLIILDDPISSFDNSKKYAIMHRLFAMRKPNASLYQKTVLLLSHDFQPIIDYVQVGGCIIDASAVTANYFRNEHGFISLIPINKGQDIMSTVLLMGELAKDKSQDVAVRIGCMRKYIEHTIYEHNNNSYAYHVLSSLIHGRKYPTKDQAGNCPLSKEESADGTAYLKSFISDFDYDALLEQCSMEALLARYQSEASVYSRILLLRMYCEQSPEARERLKRKNDVLLKYIDETFHIENDYIYMLDVRKFNIVPSHIEKSADAFVISELSIRS